MTRSRRFLAGLALVAVMGGFVAVSAAPQAQAKPEQALKAAMDKEVDGDLKTAIEMYRKVASSTDRAVAAKALLRLAACYEKLGDAQAQDVYKRLVRDFSDQPGAAEARARLETPRALGSTLVWQTEPGDPLLISSVSMDGRYMSFTDVRTGNLLVRDLAAARNRIIVSATPTQRGSSISCMGSAISHDGTQVAYSCADLKTGRPELWVASLRGDTKPRRVAGDTANPGLMPLEWSPDGKWIAGLESADRKDRLVVVSVADGKTRVLKSGFSARIFFSPDSRYVAYDLPQDVTGARDVWVTALDGSTDSAVVQSRGNDVVMGWSADGRLLVASDRISTTELIGVAIHNGTVQGAPELLSTDLGPTSPLGVTAAGALFYTTRRDTRGGSIQVAEFDPRSGSVTSPRDVSTHPQENNVNPSWSPDGKYLAYLSQRGRPGAMPVIVIRAAKTGELVREFEAKIKPETLGEWQPDSKALLVIGADGSGRSGAFRVDVATGEASFLLAYAGGTVAIPVWSADGRALYHWEMASDRNAAFFAYDVVSGADKEIVRRSFLGGLSPSPDGRFLATNTIDPVKNESVLLLVPLDGAAPREVMRVPSGATVSPTSWLPDSQSFIARVRGELWQVPVAGDSPRQLASVLDANVFKFTISPDGRRVAYRVKETASPVIQVWKYSNFLRPGSAKKK